MPSHTQKRMFFARMVIALAALTLLAQVTGAGKSSGPSGLESGPRDAGVTLQTYQHSLPSAGKMQVKRALASSNPRSLSFLPAVSYYSGGYEAFSIAVADVNGDGKPDLLVANYCVASTNCLNGLIGVLLGNGDGTFQPAVTYSSGGFHAVSLVVADVNGDGKPDLLVANNCFSHKNCVSGGVGVLLGNGDGTFRSAVEYETGGFGAASVAVADVNRDGKPDLIVADWCVAVHSCDHGMVGVLLGKGDGTFQAAVTYNSAGNYALAVAVADVNGDGKPDVVVANCASASGGSCGGGGDGVVGVLLGNGDGTFQPAATYDSGGATANSIAIADVSGDGKPDLLVMNFDSGNVGVLLGNGDGTFQPAVAYGGADAFGQPSVAVLDVNGDGKPDLLVVDFCINSNCDGGIGVFLGNSDGTFQPESVYGSGGYYASALAVADVNGDGKPDLVAANLQLTKTTPLKGFVGVLLNNTTFGKSATSTSLTSSLNPSTYGQKVTWTATVTSSGSVTPTGTVRFKWQFFTETYTIGSATLDSNGVAKLTKSNLNADAYPLTAAYSGDVNNLGSTSPVLNQVVRETTSAATITASPNPSILGQAVTFSAKITSPTVKPTGPVTFTTGKTVLGTAQLSGGKATFTTSSLPAGSTVVTVTYNGDSNIAKSTASLTQVVNP
jgi:Bacterial Ig-like domain (group 3)/FG-GAP-like repeat